MCMLTYLPADVQPDVEALSNGAEYNRDGHGFAIVSNNRILVKKSMDFDYLVGEFVRMREAHPAGPALFHSRYGTGGSVSKFNCHPFRVNHDKRTIVAHNGVLGKSVQPQSWDKRCDTHIAADHVIGRTFGHLSTPDARAALQAWIGGYNKLVILTVDPKFARNAYIINEQAGTWNEGAWYSNTDFKPLNRWTSTKAAHWWDDVEPLVCPYCQDYGDVAEVSRVCRTCGTCVDCLDYITDCQCYVPPTTTLGTPPTQDATEAELIKWWSDKLADEDGALER